MNNEHLDLNIAGMTCVNCANNISNSLHKEEGIYVANINFASSSGYFEFDRSKINEEEILSKIKSLGYSGTYNLDALEKIKENDFKTLKIDFLIALISTLIIIAIAFFPLTNGNYIMLGLASIVQFYSGRRFYISSYKALKNKSSDMNVLVAIGTSAAFFYSSTIVLFPTLLPNELSFVYFDGEAVIITFVLLGRFLEEKSKTKATSFLKKFADIAPQSASQELEDGTYKNVNVNQLNINDIVAVKAGDKISTDGLVIEGNADIDSSLITGESMLISKKTNDKVIAGTICKSGYLRISVLKKSDDTLLSNIITLLNTSSNAKLSIARFADKVASIFVPTVIIFSIFTFFLWSFIFDNMLFAIITTISVLIISCPCALGLATPITIVNAVGRGAKDGILIKNPEILEIIHTIKYAVFDKTGTLTKGEISVDHFLVSDKKYLEMIASAELKSEHPISKAIVNHAESLAVELKTTISKIETIPGFGIKASINDLFTTDILLIGTKKFLQDNNVVIDKRYLNFYDANSQKGKGVIFAAYNSKCVAVYSLSDTLKDYAVNIINFLKQKNITPILLTGDNEKVANNVAQTVGIKKVFSNVLPHEKYDVISSLQTNQSNVLFIGDGINDSLALKKADIGIAMNSGSDIAKEAGDILLINSTLKNIENTLNLSSYSMKIIRQNLFWAFIYNIIGIPIAAGILFPFFGILLTPMYAGIAMSFSSVSVVLNSLKINYLDYNK